MESSNAVIIPFDKPASKSRLMCPRCGVDAACGCGVMPVPAGERAAAAVAANPEKSDRAIAEEIGTSDTTVLRARRKQTASHEAVDKRTGKDGKARKMPGQPGMMIAVPEGKTFLAIVREGIELERGHVTIDAVVKQIGLSPRAYKVARDALLLSERDDLSDTEMSDIKAALLELDGRRLEKAAALVSPIGTRVYGMKGGRIKKLRAQGLARRIERFENAMTFLEHACEDVEQLPIPDITKAQATAAIKHLSSAQKSLGKLKDRISKQTKG